MEKAWIFTKMDFADCENVRKPMDFSIGFRFGVRNNF